MKKIKPNINKLSSRSFNVGDLVSFISYPHTNLKSSPIEAHGIVVEAVHSIVKIRPLADFSNIVLCNAADCSLVKKEGE